MGTSHANRLPKTKGFTAVAASLLSPVRNPTTVTQLALSAALRYVPATYTCSPVVFAASEGIRFVGLAESKGLEAAIKKEAVDTAADFLASNLSHELWKTTASRLAPELAGSPYAQLTEKAFKKAISSVVRKEPAERVYGTEEFLQGFLANFLFEMVQYVLHSEFSEKSTMQYYTDFEGKLREPHSIDQFESGLRDECAKRARKLVERLKKDGVLDQLGPAQLREREVVEQVAGRLGEILRQITSEE